jgi:hypothetical protein
MQIEWQLKIKRTNCENCSRVNSTHAQNIERVARKVQTQNYSYSQQTTAPMLQRRAENGWRNSKLGTPEPREKNTESGTLKACGDVCNIISQVSPRLFLRLSQERAQTRDK